LSAVQHRSPRDSCRAPSLVAWASKWLTALPPDDVTLEAIDQAQFDQVGRAYGDLRARLAGRRTLPNGLTSNVEYGPVGAAKTLFALRPNLRAPWDDFTRSKLGFDRSAASYSKYLQLVLSQLNAVAIQAGIEIAELPSLVGRTKSTPPKLIDEYYWVTITRGFVPPTREELAKWLEWADL
jgi:hypothetical protein